MKGGRVIIGITGRLDRVEDYSNQNALYTYVKLYTNPIKIIQFNR